MKLRLGTRKSPLALRQAEILNAQLNALGVEIEVVELNTTGDMRKDRQVQDKKEWILELEQALVSEKIDFAVHSAKDVPYDIEANTFLIPVLKREDPRDIFIGKKIAGTRIKFEDLKEGSNIGTASLRRQGALKLEFGYNSTELRGNVQTRIAKLDSSPELSGIVLAAAGIKRIGLEAEISSYLNPELIVPAVNQGIICVQLMSSANQIINVLQQLIDPDTKIAFELERRIIQELKADCRSAIGVHCSKVDEKITISAVVYDSAKNIKLQARAQGENENNLCQQIIQDLESLGAREIL